MIRRALLAAVATLIFAGPVAASPTTASITASPSPAAVHSPITVSWSGLPSHGQNPNLTYADTCGNGGIYALNLYASSSTEITVGCVGTVTLSIVQNHKVIASTDVEVQ